jgi:hypothetical protein
MWSASVARPAPWAAMVGPLQWIGYASANVHDRLTDWSWVVSSTVISLSSGVPPVALNHFCSASLSTSPLLRTRYG